MRITDWANASFTQAQETEVFYSIPRTYIRSVKRYDEFSTSALFDVLWLSDQVKNAYASSYAYKRGKDEVFRDRLLQEQLEESKNYITFYVLAPHAYALSEKDSDWSLSLELGDYALQPVEIKVIDLSAEYKDFFGEKYNRFRTAYRVKFDAKNSEGALMLHEGMKEMYLHCRTMKKEVSMLWYIDQEDFLTQHDAPTSDNGQL
jgi:hypothetical protein